MGVTLIAVWVMMVLAVPVWWTVQGDSTYVDTCDLPGVVGAFNQSADEDSPNPDRRPALCDAAAASRLYLTTPWIVIGVGALFFPKPKKDEEARSEAASR